MRLLEITAANTHSPVQANRGGPKREIMRVGFIETPDGTPEGAVRAYRAWEAELPRDIQRVVISSADSKLPAEVLSSLGFSHLYGDVEATSKLKDIFHKGVNGYPTPAPVVSPLPDPVKLKQEAEQRDKAIRWHEDRKAARDLSSPRWQMLFALGDWDELPAYTDTAIHDGRKTALEDRLLAVEEETRPYRRIRGKLYRGMVLTPVQKEELLRTGTIRVPQSRIGSWSKARRIAVDFSQEMPGLGIAIVRPASALDVLVDFEAVAASRTPEEKRLVDLGYAASLEREVLVRNPDPWLDITRDMVVWDNFRD